MSCIWVWKPELNVLFLAFTITNVDDASDMKNFRVVCFKSSCLFNFDNELFLLEENIANGWNKFLMSSKNLNAIYVQECKVTLFITLNWTKQPYNGISTLFKCIQIFHMIQSLIHFVCVVIFPITFISNSEDNSKWYDSIELKFSENA